MSFLPATALIWSGKCSETVGTIWKAGILEKAIYGYTLTSETTKSMAYSMLVWTSCLIWQMSLNIWIFGSTSRKIYNQISTCPNIYHESTISSITRPTNKMTIAMETGQWLADSRKWRSAKTLDEGPRIHSTNPLPSLLTPPTEGHFAKIALIFTCLAYVESIGPIKCCEWLCIGIIIIPNSFRNHFKVIFTGKLRNRACFGVKNCCFRAPKTGFSTVHPRSIDIWTFPKPTNSRHSRFICEL